MRGRQAIYIEVPGDEPLLFLHLVLELQHLPLQLLLPILETFGLKKYNFYNSSLDRNGLTFFLHYSLDSPINACYFDHLTLPLKLVTVL